MAAAASWETECTPGDWFSVDSSSDLHECAGFGLVDLSEDLASSWQDGLPGAPGVPTRAEGEEGLARLLVDRYESGRITAVDMCVFSYWAVHAGATGFVEKLAKAPGTGHYMLVMCEKCCNTRWSNLAL